jgi:nucleotide-binding universal stress UspA family protein
MIKDILVNLSIDGKGDPAADYAIAIATSLEAHLAAVAFSYEPIMPLTVMGGAPANFIDAQRRENDAAAQAAVDRFEEAARREGLSVASQMLSTSLSGAADTFGRMTRRFDLSILTQTPADRAAPEELIAENALFQSGRPVIMVPYIHRGGLKLDRIMVCWDGGRAAARAIGDAMPFLQRAKAVDVVMVLGEEGKHDALPGAEMGAHLARHGLNVDVKRVVADGGVQETLLSYAADINADFLVMGGYGHSRLREFILGGVTRGMLASMTVPCFMSH